MTKHEFNWLSHLVDTCGVPGLAATIASKTPIGAKAKAKIPVYCLECGTKFKTTEDIPECPKCGGVDIDIREGA